MATLQDPKIHQVQFIAGAGPSCFGGPKVCLS